MSYFSHLKEPKLSKPGNRKIIGLRQKEIVADLAPIFSGVVDDSDFSVFPPNPIINAFVLFSVVLKKKKKSKTSLGDTIPDL